jgi:hypothetical protein
MTLDAIALTLGFTRLGAGGAAGAEVTRAYASDLLSDVLANAPSGGLLLTIQVHLNVIAVAVHAGLAGVVFTGGMKPEPAVVAKAAEEGLALYAVPSCTFDAAGALYALGLRGSGRT